MNNNSREIREIDSSFIFLIDGSKICLRFRNNVIVPFFIAYLMFYYLSKLFDFLIMPYNLVLIGLIVIFFNVKKRSLRWWVAVIFTGFYLQSTPYVVSTLSGLWEYPPRDIDDMDRDYDVGIVLSGGLVGACMPGTSGVFDLESGSDRLLAGFFLYKKGVCRKLLLTGTDSERLLAANKGEVQLAKALLVEWGIPAEDIILETKARNTRENALYTAGLLSGMPSSDRCILVTSAYHMRRAKGCFEKVGIRAEIFPADFLKRQECMPFQKRFLPEPGASLAFHRLWHEWIGLLMYKLAGYC